MAGALGWVEHGAAEDGDRLGAGAQLLVVLGLTGFAITQPLLSLLGDEPVWFTAHGASRSQILAFAVLVALGVPLALWGVGRLLSALSPVVGRAYQLLLLVALAALAVLRILQALDVLSTPVAVVVALAAGFGFATAFLTHAAVRLWTTFTCVLPVLALVAFVLASPTGELLLQSSAASEGPTAEGDEPSMLFLMLDELPTLALLGADGAIDPVRFPNLAALAADGAWYPTYTTSSTYTSTAVPSILSGEPPVAEPPIYTRHPDNLFSLLAPTHELHVVETATSLCAPGVCGPPPSSPGTVGVVRDLVVDGADVYGERLLGHSEESAFEDVDPELQATLKEQVAEEWKQVAQRPEALSDLLGTIRPTDVPTLWFAHLMLPHKPWILYPDGTTYSANVPGGNSSDPWVNAIDEQRLLLQLQYTDALIGEAVGALKAAGEYDDAVVVVTADHGVSLIEGTTARQVVPETIEQLAYVPLIVKGPGGEQPEPDDSNVLSADLLPTVASLLDVDVPWDVDGLVIGSDAQRARGSAKELYDFGTKPRPEYHGTLRFELEAGAPSLSARLVGPIEAGDDPIAGLLDPLDVDAHLGRSIDDQASGAPVPSVTAAFSPGPARYEDPGEKLPAVVEVLLRGDLADDDLVLLELNGVVVTAAPLADATSDGAKSFLFLPPGALAEDGNALSVALVRGDEVWRLPSG